MDAIERFNTAVSKLAEFDHPDKLAEFLRAEGITGLRGNSAECPIARYLTREVNDPQYAVRVHGWGVDLYRQVQGPDGTGEAYIVSAGPDLKPVYYMHAANADAPSVVEEFIGKFDCGVAIIDGLHQITPGRFYDFLAEDAASGN